MAQATTPTKKKTTAKPAVKVVKEEGTEKDGVVQPIKAPSFKIETYQTKATYLKLLVYGDYGVGKTYLAGTACEVEEMHDVLMINAEAGDLTLSVFEGLDIITCNTYKQIARVQEFLKHHCAARDADDTKRLCELEARFRQCDISEIKKPRKYVTVIADSLTEIEEYCMYQLLGISDTTRLDEETASPEWAEYKRNHNMIKRLVRGYRDLPMHVIFTCAEQWVQDETKKFKFSPQMTGKLAKQIQGFMDMVGYLVVGQGKEGDELIRRLYVQPSPTGKYNAKCRFSEFKDPYFQNPTIEDICVAVGLLEEEE